MAEPTRRHGRTGVLRIDPYRGRAGTTSPPHDLASASETIRVPGIQLADTYWSRLRGMAGRRTLPAGILFVPGGSVHGMGMTRALDVALLAAPSDQEDRALGPHLVVKTAVLRPFGLVLSVRGVKAVLEAPAGSFDAWGIQPGSVIQMELEPT